MSATRSMIGFLAGGLLLVVIVLSHYFSIYVLSQVNSTPVARVHIQAVQNGLNGETALLLAIRSSGITPVELKTILLETDKGPILLDIENPPQEVVKIEKINDAGTVNPGGSSNIAIVFKPGYFTVGKEYSGIVFLSAGSHPVVFIVRALTTHLLNEQLQQHLRPVIPRAYIQVDALDLMSLVSESLYGIVNANVLYTNDGNLIVFSTSGSKFGGLSIVYSTDNVEDDLSQGLFFVAKVYANGSTLPGVFGIGIYMRVEDRNSPEERLVFIGLNATSRDRVNFTIAYLNVDGRGASNPGYPELNTTRVNIPLDNWYVVVAYIARTGQNDLSITGYLYEVTRVYEKLWSIRIVSQLALPVKLPGTPGQPIGLYASLVSRGTTTYEYAVLTSYFGIRICGVPAGYIVEVPCLNFRTVSSGSCINLPIPELPKESSILVYYPNNLLSTRYIVEKDIPVGTSVVFEVRHPDRIILADGVAVKVYGYISATPSTVTGLVVTNLTNTNQAPARVRLVLSRDLSNVTGLLTINVTVVDRNGYPIVEKAVVLLNGVIESQATSWSTRALRPGEEFLVYISGYFSELNSTATLVLGVELYLEDSTGLYEGVVKGQPVILHLYAYQPSSVR